VAAHPPHLTTEVAWLRLPGRLGLAVCRHGKVQPSGRSRVRELGAARLSLSEDSRERDVLLPHTLSVLLRAEFALSALGAVEGQLGRFIIGQESGEAILVIWHHTSPHSVQIGMRVCSAFTPSRTADAY
jgi:hypothetical protein